MTSFLANGLLVSLNLTDDAEHIPDRPLGDGHGEEVFSPGPEGRDHFLQVVRAARAPHRRPTTARHHGHGTIRHDVGPRQVVQRLDLESLERSERVIIKRCGTPSSLSSSEPGKSGGIGTFH
jgi:hypothetical protein